jgi:ferredoxin-thioredoxin reductase catalytic subunit
VVLQELLYYLALFSMIQILRKPGWILNPNDKIVNALFKRLTITEGECPCHNSGETKEDRMCPCKEYRENDYCCCKLYIKQDDTN